MNIKFQSTKYSKKFDGYKKQYKKLIKYEYKERLIEKINKRLDDEQICDANCISVSFENAEDEDIEVVAVAIVVLKDIEYFKNLEINNNNGDCNNNDNFDSSNINSDINGHNSNIDNNFSVGRINNDNDVNDNTNYGNNYYRNNHIKNKTTDNDSNNNDNVCSNDRYTPDNRYSPDVSSHICSPAINVGVDGDGEQEEGEDLEYNIHNGIINHSTSSRNRQEEEESPQILPDSRSNPEIENPGPNEANPGLDVDTVPIGIPLQV